MGFEHGYVIGCIVTTIALFSLSRYKLLAEREENEYDKDRTD